MFPTAVEELLQSDYRFVIYVSFRYSVVSSQCSVGFLRSLHNAPLSPYNLLAMLHRLHAMLHCHLTIFSQPPSLCNAPLSSCNALSSPHNALLFIMMLCCVLAKFYRFLAISLQSPCNAPSSPVMLHSFCVMLFHLL